MRVGRPVSTSTVVSLSLSLSLYPFDWFMLSHAHVYTLFSTVRSLSLYSVTVHTHIWLDYRSGALVPCIVLFIPGRSLYW